MAHASSTRPIAVSVLSWKPNTLTHASTKSGACLSFSDALKSINRTGSAERTRAVQMTHLGRADGAGRGAGAETIDMPDGLAQVGPPRHRGRRDRARAGPRTKASHRP